MNQKHIGSSFDEYLEEEGLREEVEARAIKQVLVYQLQDLMKEQRLSKSRLSERMKTSRMAVDRLLDPDNQSMTLTTLAQAAMAFGKQVRIEMV